MPAPNNRDKKPLWRSQFNTASERREITRIQTEARKVHVPADSWYRGKYYIGRVLTDDSRAAFEQAVSIVDGAWILSPGVVMAPIANEYFAQRKPGDFHGVLTAVLKKAGLDRDTSYAGIEGCTPNGYNVRATQGRQTQPLRVSFTEPVAEPPANRKPTLLSSETIILSEWSHRTSRFTDWLGKHNNQKHRPNFEVQICDVPSSPEPIDLTVLRNAGVMPQVISLGPLTIME